MPICVHAVEHCPSLSRPFQSSLSTPLLELLPACYRPCPSPLALSLSTLLELLLPMCVTSPLLHAQARALQEPGEAQLPCFDRPIHGIIVRVKQYRKKALRQQQGPSQRGLSVALTSTVSSTGPSGQRRYKGGQGGKEGGFHQQGLLGSAGTRGGRGGRREGFIIKA